VPVTRNLAKQDPGALPVLHGVPLLSKKNGLLDGGPWDLQLGWPLGVRGREHASEHTGPPKVLLG
jgi:hypothetical protein